VAPARHIQLFLRPSGRVGLLDLGLLVAASHGDFEIHAWRPRYGRGFRAAQFNARTGALERRIPHRLLRTRAPGGGLPPGLPAAPFPRLRGFVKLVFRDRGGKVAARARIPFCPGGDRQRVDDRGRDHSIYPISCSSTSPFVRGLVWGIESHWAAPVLEFGLLDPSVRLDPGRYRIDARITRPYRRLFGVSRRAATVKTSATVRLSPPFPGPPVGVGVGARSGAARAKAAVAQRKRVPTLRHPRPATLPDLVALPAWGIRVESRRNRDVLTFSSTVWNLGPAPLDVEGFRRPGSNRMRAFQYFSNRRGRVVGRRPAGKLRFHAGGGHDHWHFLQFARYTLLDASRRVVLPSHKRAFCLVPTDLIDLTVPGANWMAEPGELETVCGQPASLWVREVLQAGWGDTYVQSLGGQGFNVTNLPNGRYFIRIRANPLKRLRERRTSNNAALRRLVLGGTRGHRTLRVAPWRGLRA
jgi:hypothetical protein